VLAKEAVRETIVREIRAIVAEDSEEDREISGDEPLHELAINSLMLARLLVQLEAEIGVDPFGDGDVAISDVRSVADLVAAYQDARAGTRIAS